MQLDGLVALITGSGSGIGRATACILAERGASIIVHDINEAGAEETAKRVRAVGGQAEVAICDVADPAAMNRVVSDSAFEHIDILVNNAGVASDRCPIEEVTVKMYTRSFDIHVKGTLFTTQAVVPGMKDRKFGKIVNISSIQATGAYANGATYNGAKGAVLAMGKGWAKELAPWGINVNIVAPGHCLTPMPMAVDSPEVIERKAKTVPFGRYGQPEEMGYSIAFLCSPEAAFITGQVISPNGGFQI